MANRNDYISGYINALMKIRASLCYFSSQEVRGIIFDLDQAILKLKNYRNRYNTSFSPEPRSTGLVKVSAHRRRNGSYVKEHYRKIR